MDDTSVDDGTIRTFSTGANRNSAAGKYDYEGFLSPAVLSRYAEYMHKNRHLADGTLRDSDNWQKGIPQDVLVKSGFRHFMDWWALHRGFYLSRGEHEPPTVDIDEAICGLMFNCMAYLHNKLMQDAGATERGG